MAQYQSFPDMQGDSCTLDKLKALRMPELSGKRFLDVGCNEGFFCGFASYVGAARSVGLDSSAIFIERARGRFPQCEFIRSDWSALPDGLFDVVLLASALHYADDQPALVHALMSRLAPDGVLILEIGVVPSNKSEWVQVKRGIDERCFPSMPMVRKMLAGYAWKHIGNSVDQAGDPVKRHVFHVSRLRPLACLLMQPPAYGKTSIAASLFATSDVPIISGDDVLVQIADGKLTASPELAELVRKNFSHLNLDVTISELFNEGFAEEFLQICINNIKSDNFVFDMYVPQRWHATVKKILMDSGYLPIFLQWNRLGGDLPSLVQIESCADAFFHSLENASMGSLPPKEETRLPENGQGFLDEVSYQTGELVLRGWAVDHTGKLPEKIQIRLDGMELLADGYERQYRPDVQRALRLSHALVGYRIVLSLPGLDRSAIASRLQLQIPDGAIINMNKALQQMLDMEK